jgi:flagellar biosynthetic protein FlhB
MAESSEEKTEDATPKRLREAREKGQIAKSKDLSTVFELIVVFVTIALTLEFATAELKSYMEGVFQMIDKDEVTGHDMWIVGKMSLEVMIKVMLPALAAGFIAALLIGFIQVGPIFTTEPLTPKFEKLNPIEGLKNMFKIVTLIELIKNVAKLALVFYLAYTTIQAFRQDIFNASQVELVDAVSVTGEIVYSFFIKVAVVFFIIALIDTAVQRWNYMKNMRMSKDEVKREYKQDEGDPQIKSERRRLHREMVFGDTRKNVKKSDAVVSNPIHVAVAIAYDKNEMAAPEIMAKGQRRFAETILQIAREENIPVIRNIPLAWSLLALEEGDAIPEELYEPVAEVLSLVYEMKERGQGEAQAAPVGQNSANVGTPRPQEKPPSTFNPF